MTSLKNNINIAENIVEKRYFQFMYDIVCDDNYNLSYHQLLTALSESEFIYCPFDKNRAIDGIDFRYRYGKEHGYTENEIARYLDTRPCSVLEMMIALAVRGEEDIMNSDSYGDRTGQWFWEMVSSLDLGKMDDQHFNYDYVMECLDRFLFRRYCRDGHGGLFTIENAKKDLRNVDIWTQFMWYLDFIIEEE